MNRLRSLCKVQFNGMFPINKMFQTTSTSEQAKYLFIGLLLLVGIIILEFFLYMQSKLLGMVFLSASQLLLMPTIMYFAYLLTSLLITIFRGGPTLFSTKDWHLLRSLPLTNPQILGSNIFVLYFLDLMVSFFFFLPVTIAFFQLHSSPLSHLPAILLHIFLAPLLPLCIGGMISILLSFLASRLPFRKFFTTLGGIIFTVAMFSFSLFASSSQNLVSSPGGLPKTGLIGSLFKAAHFIIKGFYGGITKNILLVLGLSVASVLLFFFLYTMVYESVILRLEKSSTKRKYSVATQGTSRWVALIKKDLRMMFSSSGYIINTITGGFMMIFCSILVVRTLPDIDFIFPQIPFDKGEIYLVLLVLLTSLGSIGNPASTIISAEGITFPLLKSLPVPSSTILFSKTLLCVLYIYPFAIFSALYIGIHMGVGVLYILLALFFSLLFLYISTAIGLHCNLLFPKFQWKSMNHLIKMNMAVLVSMLLTMLLLPLIGVGGYFLYQLNPSILIFYFGGSLVVIALLLTLSLGKRAPKKLDALSL